MHSPRPAAFLIGLFALAALVTPDAASAATARVENRLLIYTAAGNNDNTLHVDGPACYSPIAGPCPPDKILIRVLDFGGIFGRAGGESISPGPGCQPADPPGPGQPPTPWAPDREVFCSGDVDSLDISLADGDDWLFAGTDKPAVIRGDGGNDRFEDGDGNDLVVGGPGDDLFRGEPGDDTLLGEGGADSYYALSCPRAPDPSQGPPECDPATRSQVSTAGDSFSGGDGDDTADFGDIHANESLSADGAKDDGKPGEGDNIGTDVENVLAGPLSDTLVGNAAANRLNGGPGDDAVVGGPGGDEVEGGAGADGLDGGTGPDTFRGGDGTDTARFGDRTAAVRVSLNNRRDDGVRNEGDNVPTDVENVVSGSGPDDLTGSAGANRLEAGSGEDFVDGRAGADSLLGGAAPDTLRLRDRSGDPRPSCGDGIDFVIADPGETAQGDCEDVDNVLRDRPVFGRRIAVQPGPRTLGLQLPAAHRLVPLLDHVNIPVGSMINTTVGKAKVTSTARVSGRRRRQSGIFSRGLFQVFQARRGRIRGLTELRLKGSSFARCNPERGAANLRSAARAAINVRRLRARARGRFRTRGRHSAATVRGTTWDVIDRCDGTLTRVSRGRVAVRDFRRRRTILVRSGKSYLARAAR
jgi:Ca2+-binding RTX toxin-like protein